MKSIMETYSRKEVNFVEGKGSWLYDENGEKYLDFVAGVAVNALGHCSEIMIDAISKQSKKLIHISNLYWNENQINLGNKIIGLSNHKNVFFSNSGTESIEVALKIAKKYGRNINKDKNLILYSNNSFHGRTMGALSVTGQNKYQEPFLPLMSGGDMYLFNDIDSIKEKMNENVCGVIIEPIQGEGGIIEAEKDFMINIKKLCDEYGALLIFDEVQCGIGRTGKFFAYENYDIVPDLVCMAKGLGGGFPIGATMAGEKAANVLSPGDHGCTFGGSPLACGVSLAVIKELTEGGVVEKVNDKNNYFVSKLTELKDKYKIIKKISGKGLLLGIDLGEYDSLVIQKAFEKKLLLVGAGNHVVRLVPALNIELKEIDECIRILEKIFLEIKGDLI